MNTTDKKISTGDTVIITESNSPTGKSYRHGDPKLMTNGVVKSRKKTSLKEFALNKHLRPEIKAGFRVWLKGDEFHFDDEWEKLFYEYNHRR